MKLYVSFAKEPYKRDYILQKRPIIFKSLRIEATSDGWSLCGFLYANEMIFAQIIGQ